MRIRNAVPEDASAIATVHVRSWKAAYPGLIPQSYLDALTPETRLGSWTDRLSSVEDDRTGTLVLGDEPVSRREHTADVAARSVVGFTSFGPADDGEEAVGEVLTLYLDPSVWGGGWGELLLAAATTRLVEAGMRRASLWVLDTNSRARRFYERLGWKHDGTSKLHDWKAFTATDVRYSIDLA